MASLRQAAVVSKAEVAVLAAVGPDQAGNRNLAFVFTAVDDLFSVDHANIVAIETETIRACIVNPSPFKIVV